MANKHASILQTYRYSKQLLIRLEYNPQSQMQRVFFNNEQRSALTVAPGYRCVHEFGGHDLVAEERGCKGSEWRIVFAVENGTLRITYQILWRERCAWPVLENKSWLTLDHNASDEQLKQFSDGEPNAPVCIRCGGSNMACYECDELVPFPARQFRVSDLGHAA